MNANVVSLALAVLLTLEVGGVRLAGAVDPEAIENNPIYDLEGPRTCEALDKTLRLYNSGRHQTFVRELAFDLAAGTCGERDPEAAAVIAHSSATVYSDPLAYLILGWLYHEGRGVERDLEESAYWFRRYALSWIGGYPKPLREARTATERVLVLFGKPEGRSLPVLQDALTWAYEIDKKPPQEKLEISRRLWTGDGLPLDRIASDKVLGLASRSISGDPPDPYALAALIERANRLIARRFLEPGQMRAEALREARRNLYSAALAGSNEAAGLLGLMWAEQSGELNQAYAYALLYMGRDGGDPKVTEALDRLAPELGVEQLGWALNTAQDRFIWQHFALPEATIKDFGTLWP